MMSSEVAKVLTGWVDVRAQLPIRSQFNVTRHDTTTKTLSHRFNQISIANAGADEYKNLIDIIFQKEEVSLFIARKLYTWFLNYNIDESVENEIIVPIAKLIRDNNYEIAPALRTLLSSEHFYDVCIIGSIIKNPIDFLLNPLNQFSVALPSDPVLKYRVFGGLYQTTFAMQMGMYQAPSVAGWQAFYQTPSYYRLWLNATSLPTRKLYTYGIASTGLPFGSYRLQLNAINILDKFPDPSDSVKVIDEFSLILFAKPLAQNQIAVLNAFLIPTTGTTGWTAVYNTYKADPTNETKRAPIANRLRTMLVYMMRMPEYHLS